MGKDINIPTSYIDRIDKYHFYGQTPVSLDKHYAIKEKRKYYFGDDGIGGGYVHEALLTKNDKPIMNFGNINDIVAIAQTYKDGQNHFICTKDHYSSLLIEHFIDKGLRILDKVDEYNIYNFRRIECKINDAVYLILTYLDEGDILYNYRTGKASKPHKKIYFSGLNAEERMKENYIMVEDKVVAEDNPDLVDYLTYGIDLDTFEIVTPIYSSFHKEYFNMDNTECFKEAIEINAKTQEKRKKLYNDTFYNPEFGNTFKRNK